MNTFANAALLLLLWCSMESAHAQSDFWQQINEPFGFPIRIIVFNSSGHIFAGTWGGGIFRTMNHGYDWVSINVGLTNLEINGILIDANDDLFVMTNADLFRSKSNGEDWVRINTGVMNVFVSCFATDSSGYLLAGAYYGGVFRSTDNGDSWQKISWPDSYTYSLAVSSNGHVFAATNCCRNVGLQTGKIFRSLDRGENWKKVYENGDRVSGLAITRSGIIFAVGSLEGVIRSTDDGESWESANSGLENVITLTFAINSRRHVFAGAWPSGLFRSVDEGESWTAINAGLRSEVIDVLAIDATDYIYTGDDSGRVFRSAEPTAVKEFLDNAPVHFALAQNYPNPFNPSTTITFSLPRASFVTLKIYNTLGEEVATLVQERREAGEYRVQWQPRGLPSGVYVYRLQAGEYSLAKKLLIVQ